MCKGSSFHTDFQFLFISAQFTELPVPRTIEKQQVTRHSAWQTQATQLAVPGKGSMQGGGAWEGPRGLRVPVGAVLQSTACPATLDSASLACFVSHGYREAILYQKGKHSAEGGQQQVKLTAHVLAEGRADFHPKWSGGSRPVLLTFLYSGHPPR